MSFHVCHRTVRNLFVLAIVSRFWEYGFAKHYDGRDLDLQRAMLMNVYRGQHDGRSAIARPDSADVNSKNPKERLRQLPSSRRTLYPPPSNLWHVNERLFEKQKVKSDVDLAPAIKSKTSTTIQTPRAANHRDSMEISNEEQKVRLDPTDFQRKDKAVRYRKVHSPTNQFSEEHELPSKRINLYPQEQATQDSSFYNNFTPGHNREGTQVKYQEAALVGNRLRNFEPSTFQQNLERPAYGSARHVSYPSPHIDHVTHENLKSVSDMVIQMQDAMQKVQEVQQKAQALLKTSPFHSISNASGVGTHVGNSGTGYVSPVKNAAASGVQAINAPSRTEYVNTVKDVATSAVETISVPSKIEYVNTEKDASALPGRFANTDEISSEPSYISNTEPGYATSSTGESALTSAETERESEAASILLNPAPAITSDVHNSVQDIRDAALATNNLLIQSNPSSVEVATISSSGNQDQHLAGETASELVPVPASDVVVNPSMQEAKSINPESVNIGSAVQQSVAGEASNEFTPVTELSSVGPQVSVDASGLEHTPAVDNLPLSTYSNPSTGEVQTVGLPMNSEDVPLSNAVASAAAAAQTVEYTPAADCLGQSCVRGNLESIPEGSFVIGSPTELGDYSEWPSGVNPGAQLSSQMPNIWTPKSYSPESGLIRGHIHPNQFVYIKQNGVLKRVSPNLFLNMEPPSHTSMRLERLGRKPTPADDGALLYHSSIQDSKSPNAMSILQSKPLTFKHHKPAGPSIAFETHIPGLTRALHSWSTSKSQSNANSSAASNANSNANSATNTKSNQKAATQTEAGSKSEKSKDGYGYGQGSGYGYGTKSWGWGGGGGWAGNPPPEGFPKLPPNYGQQPPDFSKFPQFPSAGAPARPAGTRPKAQSKQKAGKFKETYFKTKKRPAKPDVEIINTKAKPVPQQKQTNFRSGSSKHGAKPLIRNYSSSLETATSGSVERVHAPKGLMLRKFSDDSLRRHKVGALLEAHHRLH